MKIKISVDAIDLTKIAITTKPIMTRLGAEFLRMAAERMDDGTASDRTKLPDYSPAYRKFRAKHGRQTDERDLTYTGQMKAARTMTEVTDASVTVGWSDPEQAQKADWNQDLVKAKGSDGWLAPTPDEEAYLKGVAENEVRQSMKQQQAALDAEKATKT